MSFPSSAHRDSRGVDLKLINSSAFFMNIFFVLLFGAAWVGEEGPEKKV